MHSFSYSHDGVCTVLGFNTASEVSEVLNAFPPLLLCVATGHPASLSLLRHFAYFMQGEVSGYWAFGGDVLVTTAECASEQRLGRRSSVLTPR